MTQLLDATHVGSEPYGGFENQYIAGRWRPGRGDQAYKDVSPWTGQTLAEIQQANEADVDEAYRAAEAAQREWFAKLPAERAAVFTKAALVMEARKDEIVHWIMHESGGTHMKAQMEWMLVRAGTLAAASYPHRMTGQIFPIDEPGKESRSYRRPVGVIGIISPFNFPFQLTSRSAAPALACGNAVVIKPAEETFVTGGLLYAKIFEEAGLPPGLLNVVVGSSRQIGDAFVKHPAPRVISFTGSTKVGRHIAELAAQAEPLKRCSLELGGNGPCVVLDDADLDQAVPGAVVGRFMHQGQICMSTNRIIVDAKIHPQFVHRFVEHVKRLKVGRIDDPDTVIGPIINQKQLENLLEHIEQARKEGAKLLLGGKPDGLVLPPHVFADVTNDMSIARDETFGPIAPIIRAQDEEDALRIANATSQGLSSAVFTRDERRGLAFALRMEAGMTHINDTSVDDQPNSPFGGEKNSGIGRFNGSWVMDEFTTEHWITVQHEKKQYPF